MLINPSGKFNLDGLPFRGYQRPATSQPKPPPAPRNPTKPAHQKKIREKSALEIRDSLFFGEDFFSASPSVSPRLCVKTPRGCGEATLG
jgi:hypothetical protein